MKKVKLNQLITYSVAGIILIASVFVFGSTGKAKEPVQANNKQDLPVVGVFVKAGYTPNTVTAPANTSFTLRLTTKNTYDCSAALTIPKLNIDQILPPNGDTDFVVPPQKAGTIISGGCSMGMYGFQVVIQ